jgi:hypothetical protein
MSTAAISSQSILQELQTFYKSRQTDLQQLGSALQSGDLSGAQQAFQSLAVLGEGGPFANSEPFAKSSKAEAFNAVGEAIAAGNLAGAQAAFATLTGKQSAAADSASSDAATVSLSGTAASAAPADSQSSIYLQLQSYRQERTADVAQLGQDLQAGNLSAAQSDFAALTALGQSGPNKNGQTFARADRNQDFQAIGQALQSGDLAGAQSAFATLETSLTQKHQAQTAVAAYNNVAAEIVINFGGAASGTTGAPSSSSASSSNASAATPELTIDLGSATNRNAATPEIIVNLGDSSAAAASSASSSTSAATPEIVINLGANSTSSPEEIQINLASDGAGTISIGPAQADNSTAASGSISPASTASSAGQVAINFNQQGANGYELILNLLNATSTNLSQSSSSNGLSVSA